MPFIALIPQIDLRIFQVQYSTIVFLQRVDCIPYYITSSCSSIDQQIAARQMSNEYSTNTAVRSTSTLSDSWLHMLKYVIGFFHRFSCCVLTNQIHQCTNRILSDVCAFCRRLQIMIGQSRLSGSGKQQKAYERQI